VADTRAPVGVGLAFAASWPRPAPAVRPVRAALPVTVYATWTYGTVAAIPLTACAVVSTRTGWAPTTRHDVGWPSRPYRATDYLACFPPPASNCDTPCPGPLGLAPSTSPTHSQDVASVRRAWRCASRPRRVRSYWRDRHTKPAAFRQVRPAASSPPAHGSTSNQIGKPAAPSPRSSDGWSLTHRAPDGAATHPLAPRPTYLTVSSTRATRAAGRRRRHLRALRAGVADRPGPRSRSPPGHGSPIP